MVGRIDGVGEEHRRIVVSFFQLFLNKLINELTSLLVIGVAKLSNVFFQFLGGFGKNRRFNQLRGFVVDPFARDLSTVQ